MSNCVHDNGEYCEVFSDKEVRQPCFETPLCEDYKGIVHCEDCKYWDKEQTQCNYRLLTEDVHMKVMADDFCSRGVRK